MKFWQKAFFCIIAVFLLGFNVMGYILVERSYVLNRNYAVASAEVERRIIKRAVHESLILSRQSFTELNAANLNVIMSPYAFFYENQGVYFQLYKDGVLVFNNLPVAQNTERLNEEIFFIPENTQLIKMQEIEGNLYCFIASYMYEPFNNLRFVYIKDMQALSDFQSEIIELFAIISVIVSFILAVVMLLLLIGLTRPFRKLNAVTSEISLGNYDKRVAIESSDELGDFAKNFNLMADCIEDHISLLSSMTESKQKFIDNLAHEIRTPITSIIGYGELLKYANCTEEDKQVAIHHIINQSRRIQNMSSKLLDLAYMNNENIEMLSVKLEDMLDDIKAEVNPLLQAKNIKLYINMRALSIKGDAELIKSLLINLVDNAINASDTESTIEIHIKREIENAIIEIIDYGKGMDNSEIMKITEPFYRVDKSRSRSGGGVGLGLALCARICEIHNASFEISSDLGKGTTVKVIFNCT